MSRFYSEDQEYTNEFLKIVEAHGGENCKHWTKVARVYFESTGIQVNQTYKLRKRWETLTNYKENLNEEQTQILYETGIKSRGNNRGGLQSFQQKTGIKMYLGRYTRTISTWLRAAIKMFQEMYIHDKKTRYRRLDEDNYRLSYVSIHIMLRAVDVQETKDPIFQELKNCAIKLEELLFLHAKIHNNMGIEKYSVYKDLISRWEFRRIMFYLDYVNELKQISISYYERLEILAHPLLKPTIELNRQCEIYQRIILESDWRSKYELYNQCSALEGDQEYSMLIKKANKKNNDKNPVLQNYDVVSKTAHKICNKAAHAQITQSERQKLRTFRGHYVRPGQIKSRGWTTILFDHDMSSSQIEDENQDNVEDREQYVQKMQKLFECTFGKENKKNKKQSKNKFYSF